MKIKKNYEDEFKAICKKNPKISYLKGLVGIGPIHAVEIAATVVEARRFKSVGHFLSYCGLVKHERSSGGKDLWKESCKILSTLEECIYNGGSECHS